MWIFVYLHILREFQSKKKTQIKPWNKQTLETTFVVDEKNIFVGNKILKGKDEYVLLHRLTD